MVYRLLYKRAGAPKLLSLLFKKILCRLRKLLLRGKTFSHLFDYVCIGDGVHAVLLPLLPPAGPLLWHHLSHPPPGLQGLQQPRQLHHQGQSTHLTGGKTEVFKPKLAFWGECNSTCHTWCRSFSVNNLR